MRYNYRFQWKRKKDYNLKLDKFKNTYIYCGLTFKELSQSKKRENTILYVI